MKGDTLAKGATRAQFPPAGGRITQEKWDSMFEDFDPEKYLEKKETTEKS